MDYNTTKLFTATVQAGGLSATSEKTGMPISTLSRKMNELERGFAGAAFGTFQVGRTAHCQGARFFQTNADGH